MTSGVSKGVRHGHFFLRADSHRIWTAKWQRRHVVLPILDMHQGPDNAQRVTTWRFPKDLVMMLRLTVLCYLGRGPEPQHLSVP